MTIAKEESERELPSSNFNTRRKNIQSRILETTLFQIQQIETPLETKLNNGTYLGIF